MRTGRAHHHAHDASIRFLAVTPPKDEQRGTSVNRASSVLDTDIPKIASNMVSRLPIVSNTGYLVTSARTTAASDLQEMMSHVSYSLGSDVSATELAQQDQFESLPVHTEGIYLRHPLRYFLLACVEPSETGGETTIYDGRVAASIILSEHPELAGVITEYKSSRGPDAYKRALLASREDAAGGSPVLVFREWVEANHVLELPTGWDLNSFYLYMQRVLSRSLIIAHRWQPGDVMLIDNHLTLHGRAGFTGTRRMIRMRVNA